MDERIKVLWLIKGLGPGGAERLLVSTARLGDHARFDYHAAYVLPHKTQLVPELEANSVSTHCLSDRGTGTWPVALRRLVAQERFDVVHLHSPLVAGIARPALLSMGRATRPAIVSTEHNAWDSYSLPTRLLNASLYATDRCRWAVSTRVRESIPRPLRTQVRVLVHGIVIPDFSALASSNRIRSDVDVREDEIVAITVANFRREKGYPDLLHAVDAATRAVPGLCVLVVGQGPLESEIRRLHAELRLDDRCRILGYRSDIPDLLAASDFFVMASHFEGFPIALMEAMAAGLPVVATRVGGIPDAVCHGVEGLLVDPGAPADLASCMIRLAGDDLCRAEMGQRARSRAVAFDVATAVEHLQETYAALGRHRARSDR